MNFLRKIKIRKREEWSDKKMKSDIEDKLKSVRDIFVFLPKRYDKAKDELRIIENEIQDLLHVIEFASLSAVEMTRKYKELKEARLKRRSLKDELELLESIRELTSFPKPNEKNISRTIGNVRHILNKQKNRTYTMKERKDLQELIK